MTYLTALQHAHRIEVNGEATYAAAARWTRSPEHLARWQVLADLETRMKDRVAAEIVARGGVALERTLDIRAGRVYRDTDWPGCRARLRAPNVNGRHVSRG